MSMEHKAYVFDYESFVNEFSTLLKSSLATKTTEGIANFIHNNLSYLKDPYEGEPLDSSWEEMLEEMEFRDVHNYGDFAMTKFYKPDENYGLAYAWQNIENILIEELDERSCEPEEIILGQAFGHNNNWFNPGRMGSYFQSPQQVKQNMQIIQNLVALKPQLLVSLADLLSMFQKAVDAQKGLYITF